MCTNSPQSRSFRQPLAAIAGLVLLSASIPIAAQEQANPNSGTGDSTQTPGPEHKVMEIWTGDWSSEGDFQTTPFGPGGHVKGKESSKMILNGFFWEDRWQDSESGDAGPHGTVYLRYDPKTKTYIDYSFASDGTFGSTTNIVNGNTWNGFGTQTAPDGKEYRTRFLRKISADGMKSDLKAEYSPDEGKSWKTWWEFTNRKLNSQRPIAKEAIAASNEEFAKAVMKRDTKTIRKQYTKDAKMFVDRQPIYVGNAAIGESYKDLGASIEATKVTCQSTEVVETGDWAYETGMFLMAEKDGNIAVDNKYLCIWKFEDGAWKVHRDMANENPPAEEQNAKNGIDQWHRTYGELFQKGDAPAVSMMYTQDAEIHRIGKDTIRGRAAIQRLVKEDIEIVQKTGVRFELTTLDVQENGDTAHNIVKILEKGTDGKVTEIEAVGFWKKQNGVWKLHRDTWIPINSSN